MNEEEKARKLAYEKRLFDAFRFPSNINYSDWAKLSDAEQDALWNNYLPKQQEIG